MTLPSRLPFILSILKEPTTCIVCFGIIPAGAAAQTGDGMGFWHVARCEAPGVPKGSESII